MKRLTARKIAMQAGQLRYATGKPCVRGHIAERYVSTMQCVECVSEHTATWKAANPESIKAIKRNYRTRNPHKVKAWKAADQKRNAESARARQRRYVAAHREAVNARTEAWAKANPGKRNARAMRYHADKLQRTPAWADLDAISGMYELAQVFRNVGVMVEVDHAIPLRGRSVSGLHVHDNLQLIHSAANKAKSNRFQGA